MNLERRTILHPSERDFLARARVGHLATVNRGGTPSVVPVCFVMLEGQVYSAIDEKPKSVPPTELRRVRDLLASPRVALVVDEYDEDWARLAFVQLRGQADLIWPDHPDHDRAVGALRQKYPQYRTMNLAARPIIRIEVELTRSWAARSDRFTD